jgi:hypothetical protein
VGSFDAASAGSYLVNVVPGPGIPPIVTGASVPYSDEYRVRKTNMSVLQQISGLTPKGGEPGTLTGGLSADQMKDLLSVDTYRGGLPKATSLQDIWPLCVLLGSLCLFGDIFVRRVALDYAYPFKWAASKLSGKKLTQADVQRQASMDRLRSRKSQVSEETQSNLGTVRFESDQPVDSSALDVAMSAKPVAVPKPSAAPSLSRDESHGDSYTARLLAAKKAAKKQSENDP